MSAPQLAAEHQEKYLAALAVLENYRDRPSDAVAAVGDLTAEDLVVGMTLMSQNLLALSSVFSGLSHREVTANLRRAILEHPSDE